MKKLLIATTSFLLLGASAELPTGPQAEPPAEPQAEPPAGSPFQEAPAAVVVSVQGAVEVVLGGAPPTAAAVGTRLASGDQVIPEGGVATIVHASGRTERVTETLTIPSASGDTEAGAFSRTVRVLASAATTDARGNPNRQGMIRPIPGEPVLIAPRNGLRVMGVRPTFAWHSVEGATEYRIQVRNLAGGMARYEASDTTWSLPTDAPDLERGQTYAWTVAPSGSGRPTREQRFMVLGEDEYGEVAGALESLTAAGLDPAGAGALMATAVFREVGLFYDASSTLAGMGEEELSADVFLLKGEILDALGDLEGAGAAFDKADRLMR